MDKEKQIEALKAIVKHACNKEGIAKHCPERIAEALVNAGYANVKQAVKELVDKLLTELEEQKRFYETAHISHGDISATAINHAIKYTKRLYKELYDHD